MGRQPTGTSQANGKSSSQKPNLRNDTRLSSGLCKCTHLHLYQKKGRGRGKRRERVWGGEEEEQETEKEKEEEKERGEEEGEGRRGYGGRGHGNVACLELACTFTLKLSASSYKHVTSLAQTLCLSGLCLLIMQNVDST